MRLIRHLREEPHSDTSTSEENLAPCSPDLGCSPRHVERAVAVHRQGDRAPPCGARPHDPPNHPPPRRVAQQRTVARLHHPLAWTSAPSRTSPRQPPRLAVTVPKPLPRSVHGGRLHDVGGSYSQVDLPNLRDFEAVMEAEELRHYRPYMAAIQERYEAELPKLQDRLHPAIEISAAAIEETAQTNAALRQRLWLLALPSLVGLIIWLLLLSAMLTVTRFVPAYVGNFPSWLEGIIPGKVFATVGAFATSSLVLVWVMSRFVQLRSQRASSMLALTSASMPTRKRRAWP